MSGTLNVDQAKSNTMRNTRLTKRKEKTEFMIFQCLALHGEYSAHLEVDSLCKSQSLSSFLGIATSEVTRWYQLHMMKEITSAALCRAWQRNGQSRPAGSTSLFKCGITHTYTHRAEKEDSDLQRQVLEPATQRSNISVCYGEQSSRLAQYINLFIK